MPAKAGIQYSMDNVMRLYAISEGCVYWIARLRGR
jgi:hypothetical protein